MKKYLEILHELHEGDSKDYKKMRQFHKELKKFGSGIPFHLRYPFLPIYLSGASLLFAIGALILRVIEL